MKKEKQNVQLFRGWPDMHVTDYQHGCPPLTVSTEKRRLYE